MVFPYYFLKDNILTYIPPPSSYGYRKNVTPHEHYGLDIMTSYSNIPNMEGEKLLAVDAGKVIYVSNSSTVSQGYCIAIQLTDDKYKAPVTGHHLIVIYMHMLEDPDKTELDFVELKAMAIKHIAA